MAERPTSAIELRERAFRDGASYTAPWTNFVTLDLADNRLVYVVLAFDK